MGIVTPRDWEDHYIIRAEVNLRKGGRDPWERVTRHGSVMHIVVGSKAARAGLIAVALAAFAGLAAWIVRVNIAEQSARRPTVENLQRAVRLDPGNPTYALRLGRLHQYSMADMDPERAQYYFRRAAQLSPYDAQPWLNLAAALEFQGQAPEAEKCLKRADFLAPNIASVQWTIGNFFLLHGNVEAAFRHFQAVLAGSRRYNPQLFSIAWKASDDGDFILERLIPHRLQTEFEYLYFLISQQRFPEAFKVWQRIATGAETFLPRRTSGYIDSLVKAGRPAEAFAVWSDLRNRGLIKSTYGASKGNLLGNGDFEEDILNMGFDWRIIPRQGVYAGIDRIIYRSASSALLVHFAGKDNLDYRHVSQLVKVMPGRPYRLRGYFRTEGLTADSGPHLRVQDRYDPGALSKLSEEMTGTTRTWMPFTLEFTTGPKTELVAVEIVRFRSRKLNSLIAGKLWVDDLSLTEVGTDTTGSSVASSAPERPGSP